MHDDIAGAVLAAGLGTRLRPVTDRCPKPLVPVVGRPLLAYALDALAAVGIREIGVNLHHLADRIPAALAHRPERLHFVVEETLAGTGGGLRGIAARLPRRTILCVNGDALFDFDLAAVLAHHHASRSVATLVLRRPRPEEPFGRVGVDATDQIQRIAEVEGREPHRNDLRFGVYTGVQIVSPALVDALPPAGECDVLRTAYRDRLAAGDRITGYFVPDDALWLDVGNEARLLDAQRAVLAREPGGPSKIDPSAVIGPGVVFEAPCAVLAGATVGAGARIGPGCVVDQGAQVAPGADLENCLVWTGARAEGRIRDRVVLPADD
jgi:mannose-1-phosphate guanylyltransferase